MTSLDTRHGPLRFPAFLPDATQAVVKTIDAQDARGCGVQAIMVNVLHLSAHPGVSVVKAIGGVHAFMGWDGPLASDSGGFQAFSLVNSSRKLGSISKDGFTYRFDPTQDKKTLTPEKCIERQFQLGTDIMFCLDLCTHPEADDRVQRESVDYTVAWAKRCRAEFDRRMERRDADAARPLLFAIVQGGARADLRKECAERLLEIGFDGYGYGGWPIDDTGALVDMVGHVAELIPASFPKHALGIGKPGNIARAHALGYAMFDCVLPTRDARRQRLYAFREGWERMDLAAEECYDYVYLQDDKHARDGRPVDAGCDCACCSRYSRGYLHHLFTIDDPTGPRLATIHNLRFYARFMERLRTGAAERA